MFAANRTPRDTPLASCETNSIATSNGAKIRGLPAGIIIAIKSAPKLSNPKSVTPIRMLKLRPKPIMIWAVGVKVYGTIPIRFMIERLVKMVQINGIYLPFPILSKTMLTI